MQLFFASFRVLCGFNGFAVYGAIKKRCSVARSSSTSTSSIPSTPLLVVDRSQLHDFQLAGHGGEAQHGDLADRLPDEGLADG